MRRLMALSALPMAVLAQCDPGCVPTSPAATQVAWTLNWDRVAWCESGGDWDHGPVRNSAGTFSGGLMIGHAYWKGYGGYSAPYLAPKAVQIAWAEDLIDGSYAKADQAWQCVGGPARSGV